MQFSGLKWGLDCNAVTQILTDYYNNYDLYARNNNQQ